MSRSARIRKRVRVLIVDDNPSVRRLLSASLAADPEIDVQGESPNGRAALAAIRLETPDVVVLDLDMPVMNGFETLSALRPNHPRLPVIVFSTFTTQGAEMTLQALWRGATDYVSKPPVSNPEAAEANIRTELIPRIKAFAAASAAAEFATKRVSGKHAPADPDAPADDWHAVRRGPPRLIAIAASTGGPRALATLLGRLPGDLPVPLLVVQHMPSTFTRHFADGLASQCDLRVHEAHHGAVLERGCVWIAPGDRHLVLAGDGVGIHLELTDEPHENACRPSADPLFRSVAARFGSRALAIVMTGMGQDGLAGCREIRAQGGEVLVQDEASSVVWGMPGSIVRAGLAHARLSPEALADRILERFEFNDRRHAA